MKQENFPSLKKLGFANIDGGVTDRVTNSFISFIRDKPELIYNILSYEKKKEKDQGKDEETNKEKNKNEILLKEEDICQLFDYILNLFYGGSISNKKIEEYVLALIWTFLQDALNEINDEKNIMNIFNKRIGCFFEYLYKQKEIKEYFNKILSFEFKTIEFNNNGNWLFEEMKDINEDIAEQIRNEMEEYKNTMDETEKKIFNEQFNEKKAIFTKKNKKI